MICRRVLWNISVVYVSNYFAIKIMLQVTFHVATLMPTRENDPNCNAKKLHIGNDYVTIVYNESGEQYNIRTVKVCMFTMHYINKKRVHYTFID